MSEKEKGAIMQQMQALPPLLKAKAEGFVQGLAAGMAASASQPDQGKNEKEAEQNGKM